MEEPWLNYTDYLGSALLLPTNSQIQETTQRLDFFIKQVGPNIGVKKTSNVMALNTTNSPVQVENEDLTYTDKLIPKRNCVQK